MAGSNLYTGTLDLLILKAVSWGPRHGYAIGRWMRETTDDVLVVQVPNRVREQMVAGDVVLVAMAVDHAVDGGNERRPADERERRIDDQRLLRAFDQERVAVRILAAADAAENGDVPDRPIRAALASSESR